MIQVSKFVFCFILFIISQIVAAQTFEVVNYDTLRKGFDKELIFDKPFHIVIPFKGTPPSLLYLEHKRGKNFYASIQRYVKEGNNDPIKTVIPSNLSLFQKDKVNYMNALFGFNYSDKRPYKSQNNILKPNKDYSFLLPSNRKECFSIFEAIHKGKLQEAQNTIAGLKLQEITKQQEAGIDIPVVLYIQDMEKAQAFYIKYLKGDFDKLDKLISKNDNLHRYNYPYNSLFISSLNKVQQLNDQLESFASTIKSTAAMISRLKRITTTNYLAISKGDISLKNYGPPKNPDRRGHLSELEEFLVKIIDSVQILSERHQLSVDIDPLNKHLELVRENIKLTNEIDETIGRINKTTFENKYFLNITFIGGESTVLNFETRSKFQLTPDFGLVYYGFQKGFNGLAPYIGFHINFRYVHKDYPYWKVPNKRFIDHFSVMVAYTLVDFDEGEKRESFFEKSALVLGVGYRVTNALRVVGGPLLFYGYDTRAYGKNKSLRATPFLGVSIDLNVRQYLNTFTDALLK